MLPRSVARIAVIALGLGLGPNALGAQLPSMPPAEFVSKTVQNEVRASQGGAVPHMFISRKETSRGSQTKLYCETRDAMAGMAIANDDKPLTGEQRQVEETRLRDLANSPEELRKKAAGKGRRRASRTHCEGDARCILYEYDGMETGRTGLGKQGSDLVRLKFKPNPNYEPPTHTEQVLLVCRATC
jgi:hypothetical protein